MSDTLYDIAVIGAGPAGAQAAISGCHQMRHVLVLDAGGISRREGRAYWSKSVELEDVPVFTGITGPRLKKALREWMDSRPVRDVTIAGEDRKYGIEVRPGVVLKLEREGDAFHLDASVAPLDDQHEVQAKETFRARTVVVASGFEDEWPDIEHDPTATRLFDQYRVAFRYAGNKRGWHVCIRCDGHLHIDQKMAFYGVGDYIYEMVIGAQDFTDKLTVLTDGRPHDMSAKVHAHAMAMGVEIDERKIVKHIGEKTNLLGFEMEDGEQAFFHGFFVDEGLDPNTKFLEGWDVATDEDGLLEVDEDNQVQDSAGEPVPGLYAAGDIVAGERKLVTASFGMGQNAGICASDSLRKWKFPR